MQADIAITTQDTWRTHYATRRGFRFWPNEELVRAVGERWLGRVMEAGCGNGANLWFLAEHADLVVGVDGCVQAVIEAEEYMRQRGVSERVAVMHGDIFRLPGASGSFDAIIDVMVSQHITWSQHLALYREYRRVLRPGGWLFLFNLGHGTTRTGSRQLETFTYDELPDLYPEVSPVCLPQGPAVKEALTLAGFHPTSSRQLGRTYGNGSATVHLVMEATAV